MLNVRKLLSILMIGCIGLKANAQSIDNDKEQRTNVTEKREPISEFISEMISAGIQAGASLAGTSVNALMDSSYRVATSGSVENYSKWRMIYQGCTTERGYMNKPMINVEPGKKEGFASHKADSSTAGSWVYCYYRVNDKRIHIMYSAPFNFDHYTNSLALAITSRNVKLNANNMYYNDYNYMDRKGFYTSVTPVEICQRGFCIKGTMGTSHQPVIIIKLYPKNFENIAPKIKKSLEEVDGAEAKYDKFIKDEFRDS